MPHRYVKTMASRDRRDKTELSMLRLAMLSIVWLISAGPRRIASVANERLRSGGAVCARVPMM